MKLDQLFAERQTEARALIISRQAAVDLTEALPGASYFVRPHSDSGVGYGKEQTAAVDLRVKDYAAACLVGYATFQMTIDDRAGKTDPPDQQGGRGDGSS